jgi:hypothetical protein
MLALVLKGFIGGVVLIVLRLVSLAAQLAFGLLVVLALAWAVLGGLAAGWHGVLKGAGIPLVWALLAFLFDIVAGLLSGWLAAWMARGQNA